MVKAQRRCTGHGSIEVRHRPDAELGTAGNFITCEKRNTCQECGEFIEADDEYVEVTIGSDDPISPRVRPAFTLICVFQRID
jgi:hypothetical protein